MRRTEEHKENKYLIVHIYMLNKESDQIKKIIGIEKLDDTKILIDMDDKLPDDITLKNVVMLMTCAKKMINIIDKYF